MQKFNAEYRIRTECRIRKEQNRTENKMNKYQTEFKTITEQNSAQKKLGQNSNTFRWPWESMLRVFNSFFKDLWVMGTSLPTRVDICKLHIMVACAHNVGCNQALVTPVRLGLLTWRPSTNMRSINSSYASLHWREPIICKQDLYMWMKEDKIVICANILIERSCIMKWFTSNQG